MALIACLHACGPITLDVSDAAESTAGPEITPIPAGSAVVVVIVNPVVNSTHAGGVPGELGQLRDEIAVEAEPGGAAVTLDGLAVAELAPGSLELRVGAATLSLDVSAMGDIIDAPIAYDGASAAYFSNTPLRYPAGAATKATRLDPETPRAAIAAALAKDGAVVVLRPGVYAGDLAIEGHGVLLLGEGWTDHAAVIDGSLTADGDDVRVRGVTITGDLVSTGTKFAISFSRVLGATSVTADDGVFVRNIFCEATTIPASIALDNFGLGPIEEPPAGACDP